MPGVRRSFGGGLDGELFSGVASWNAGRFCEAADRFEDVWVGEVGARRACLRGLIHVAMGLHYLGVEDAERARAKLATAARLLEPLAADELGLDLGHLRSGVALIRARLEAEKGGGDPLVAIRGVPLPRLRAASGEAARSTDAL